MDDVDKIKKGNQGNNGQVSGPDKIVKIQLAAGRPLTSGRESPFTASAGGAGTLPGSAASPFGPSPIGQREGDRCAITSPLAQRLLLERLGSRDVRGSRPPSCP